MGAVVKVVKRKLRKGADAVKAGLGLDQAKRSRDDVFGSFTDADGIGKISGSLHGDLPVINCLSDEAHRNARYACFPRKSRARGIKDSAGVIKYVVFQYDGREVELPVKPVRSQNSRAHLHNKDGDLYYIEQHVLTPEMKAALGVGCSPHNGGFSKSEQAYTMLVCAFPRDGDLSPVIYDKPDEARYLMEGGYVEMSFGMDTTDGLATIAFGLLVLGGAIVNVAGKVGEGVTECVYDVTHSCAEALNDMAEGLHSGEFVSLSEDGEVRRSDKVKDNAKKCLATVLRVVGMTVHGCGCVACVVGKAVGGVTQAVGDITTIMRPVLCVDNHGNYCGKEALKLFADKTNNTGITLRLALESSFLDLAARAAGVVGNSEKQEELINASKSVGGKLNKHHVKRRDMLAGRETLEDSISEAKFTMSTADKLHLLREGKTLLDSGMAPSAEQKKSNKRKLEELNADGKQKVQRLGG